MNSFQISHAFYAIGIFFIGIPLIAELDKEQFSLEHVSLVHKRYFLVRRLEKTVRTFHEHQQLVNKTSKPLLADMPSKTYFSHPAVRAVAVEIAAEHTCAPFAKVWDDFLSYKFLNSDIFGREFIVLLILLYKEVITATASTKSAELIYVQSRVNQIIEKDEHGSKAMIEDSSILESLQFIPEDPLMRSQYPKPELTAILTEHHTFKELYRDESADLGTHFNELLSVLDSTDQCCDFIIYNNMRFYHIQRLLRSIYLLTRSSYLVVPFCVEMNDYFTHPEIILSAQEMCNTQQIIPLLKLWKRFSSYDFIDDELFVREYLRLLCITYAHIKTPEQIKNGQKDISIEDVIALYEKMQDLPINDLLNLLDDMVEHFEHISEQYEMQNQALSWRQWFKKYWWAPPVVVGSFLLLLLKHRHLFGYVSKQNYLPPGTGIGSLASKPPTIGIPVSSHNFEIL